MFVLKICNKSILLLLIKITLKGLFMSLYEILEAKGPHNVILF